jgi:hypothetical protein
MIDERFVLLGAALVTLGGVSYLLDTLAGRNQPNKVTWLMWGVAPLVAFAAQVSEGVGIAAAATFAVGFMPLLIFAASFVNAQAQWRIGAFDIVCGVLSVAGLVLWAVTSDANLAILFAIIADFLAAVPTISKAWSRPQTESSTLFWTGIVNGAIGLLIVDVWAFEEYGFIAYILLINVFLALLITFRPARLLRGADGA